MIPEYKRYHGAVFAELVDEIPGAVTIEEWPERGRIASYVVNDRLGVVIKHSSSRMRPWIFTMTPSNFEDIARLRERCQNVFVVLICWHDGMVCIDDAELQTMISEDPSRSWLRAERKKGELYSVYGARAELPYKRSNGIAPILQALDVDVPVTSEVRIPELPRSSFAWLRHLLGRLSGGSAG